MIPNANKTFQAIFGTIAVTNAESGNPVIYGLFDKNDVPVNTVRFQDGAPPCNGFCVEDLIAITIDRLQHLDSELPSDFNKVAIDHLLAANKALADRIAAQRAAAGTP
jgi:hypothetical protein